MSQNAHTKLHKGWALALLASVQFMLILDASIVNVALPSIDRHFQVGSVSTLGWVLNGYLLTFGGLLLLGGRLADRLGRRRLFFAGTLLFGAASLGAGVAPSFGFLVAARLVQGAGAALVAPAALSLVTVIFEEGQERNKALGVWGAISGTGGAAGLIMGGVLTSGLGWRWVFFVNLPVVLAALVLTPRLLPEATGEQAGGTFDAAGATTVVAGVGALIYGFVQAGNHGWGATQTDVALGVGLALLTAFIAIERRSRNPLIRFGLFRSRTISGGNLVALTFGVGAIAVWFYLALYLQQVEHYSALKAGVASLPLNGALMTTATLSSKWITRFGPKPVLAGGLAVFAAGMYWFHFITASASYATDVLGPIIVMGAGLGAAFVGVTVAAVTGVDPEEAGLASGLYNTTLQVGEAIGLAILTTISTTAAGHALAHHSSHQAALAHGFSNALLVGSGVLVGALLIALFVLSSRANREFVRIANSSDSSELEIDADTLSAIEGIGAIAGLEAEYGVETARTARAAALHASVGREASTRPE
jgi:EmrB/QacA subfamily drug resistance transporter